MSEGIINHSRQIFAYLHIFCSPLSPRLINPFVPSCPDSTTWTYPRSSDSDRRHSGCRIKRSHDGAARNVADANAGGSSSAASSRGSGVCPVAAAAAGASASSSSSSAGAGPSGSCYRYKRGTPFHHRISPSVDPANRRYVYDSSSSDEEMFASPSPPPQICDRLPLGRNADSRRVMVPAASFSAASCASTSASHHCRGSGSGADTGVSEGAGSQETTSPNIRESKGKGKAVKGSAKNGTHGETSRSGAASPGEREIIVDGHVETERSRRNERKRNEGASSARESMGETSASACIFSPISVSSAESVDRSVSTTSATIASSSASSSITLSSPRHDVSGHSDPGEMYPDLQIDDTSSDDDVEVVAIAKAAALKTEKNAGNEGNSAKTGSPISGASPSSLAARRGSARTAGLSTVSTSSAAPSSAPNQDDDELVIEVERTTQRSAVVVDLTHESDDEVSGKRSRTTLRRIDPAASVGTTTTFQSSSSLSSVAKKREPDATENAEESSPSTSEDVRLVKTTNVDQPATSPSTREEEALSARSHHHCHRLHPRHPSERSRQPQRRPPPTDTADDDVRPLPFEQFPLVYEIDRSSRRSPSPTISDEESMSARPCPGHHAPPDVVSSGASYAARLNAETDDSTRSSSPCTRCGVDREHRHHHHHGHSHHHHHHSNRFRPVRADASSRDIDECDFRQATPPPLSNNGVSGEGAATSSSPVRSRSPSPSSRCCTPSCRHLHRSHGGSSHHHHHERPHRRTHHPQLSSSSASVVASSTAPSAKNSGAGSETRIGRSELRNPELDMRRSSGPSSRSAGGSTAGEVAHSAVHHRPTAAEEFSSRRRREGADGDDDGRGVPTSAATPAAARFWEADAIRTPHRPRPLVDVYQPSAATSSSSGLAPYTLTPIYPPGHPLAHVGRSSYGTRSNLPLQHQRLLDQQQSQQERQRRWYDQHLISVRRQQESQALQMHYGFAPPATNLAPVLSDAASSVPNQSARTHPLDWASQSHLINHHFR